MLESPLGLGLLLLFGIFTGTLAGLLGIGGGLLLVPALIVAGAETTVKATATSLIGVFLSATSGSIRNLRAGDLNWKASLTLAAFGIITAQLGALLGSRLSDTALSLGFAALLFLAIYLLGLKKKLATRKQRQHRAAIAHQPPQQPGPSHPGKDANHGAPSETVDNYQFFPMAGIGLAAGALAGLFGVGGGVIMVPLQMLLLGEDIKAAVRTSLGAIVAIAASGLIQHTLNDNVLWLPGLVLGIGGIIGAQFGTRLLPRLPDRVITIMFRILLIALAVYMIVRAINP